MNKTIIKRRANKEIKADNSTLKRNTNIIYPLSFMIPALIFFLLYTIIPLITVFQDSTLSGDAYSRLWHDTEWTKSVEFSFEYALITLPISLFLSLIVASLLSTMIRTKLRGFWQTIFFIPYVTSLIAVSVTFANIFNSEYGIINSIFGIEWPWLTTDANEGYLTLFTIIIFGIWQSMAFQILILTTAMLSVDRRLYDAAAIDGINGRKQFFNITLPSIRRTITYLIVIGLINCTKVFPLALFQNDELIELQYGPTMLVYIYAKVQSGAKDLAGAASVSLIVLLIAFNVIINQLINLTAYLVKKTKEIRSDKKIDNLKRVNIKSGQYHNFEHKLDNIISLKGGANNEQMNDKI